MLLSCDTRVRLPSGLFLSVFSTKTTHRRPEHFRAPPYTCHMLIHLTLFVMGYNLCFSSVVAWNDENDSAILKTIQT